MRKAADSGLPEAQYNMAVMYHHGEGVSPDLPSAVRWYQLAAEAGDPRAQQVLGVLYVKGTGVTADPVEAMKWLMIAATSGDPALRDSAKAKIQKLSPAVGANVVSAGAQAAKLWLTKQQWQAPRS